MFFFLFTVRYIVGITELGAATIVVSKEAITPTEGHRSSCFLAPFFKRRGGGSRARLH